jgi:hypothetical protein
VTVATTAADISPLRIAADRKGAAAIKLLARIDPLCNSPFVSGAQNGHTYTSVFANTLIALTVLSSVDPIHHGGDR